MNSIIKQIFILLVNITHKERHPQKKKNLTGLILTGGITGTDFDIAFGCIKFVLGTIG